MQAALGANTNGAANDDKRVVATFKSPLASGKYTVNWTAAGDDGHPTKGSFDFTVKAGK